MLAFTLSDYGKTMYVTMYNYYKQDIVTDVNFYCSDRIVYSSIVILQIKKDTPCDDADDADGTVSLCDGAVSLCDDADGTVSLCDDADAAVSICDGAVCPCDDADGAFSLCDGAACLSDAAAPPPPRLFIHLWYIPHASFHLVMFHLILGLCGVHLQK